MEQERGPIRPELNEFYDARYREYAGEHTIAYDIYAYIEDASSARVRPDARLFLLINYHQLFVEPLTQTGLMDREEALLRTRQDVERILEEAEYTVPENDVVSSHACLYVVTQLWNNLHISDEAIWSATAQRPLGEGGASESERLPEEEWRGGESETPFD